MFIRVVFLTSPRRRCSDRDTADTAAVEVLAGHDHDEDEGQQPQQSEQGDESRVEPFIRFEAGHIAELDGDGEDRLGEGPDDEHPPAADGQGDEGQQPQAVPGHEARCQQQAAADEQARGHCRIEAGAADHVEGDGDGEDHSGADDDPQRCPDGDVAEFGHDQDRGEGSAVDGIGVPMDDPVDRGQVDNEQQRRGDRGRGEHHPRIAGFESPGRIRSGQGQGQEDEEGERVDERRDAQQHTGQPSARAQRRRSDEEDHSPHRQGQGERVESRAEREEDERGSEDRDQPPAEAGENEESGAECRDACGVEQEHADHEQGDVVGE